jgi:hypothetical protein
VRTVKTTIKLTIRKTMNNKAIRTTIEISGISVEVFRLPDGQYVMSQSQVALVIEVQSVLVLRFLSEKWLEGKLDKDYRSYKLPTQNDTKGRGGNNRQIKPIDITLASEFWAEQAFKGNKLAQALTYACILETLKRRCDNAFDIAKTTEQYEHESITNRTTWLESRSFLKDAHISFTNCCLYNGFNAAIAHDSITKAVLGKTAQELREDDVINGDYRIGLNHVQRVEELTKIAKVKLAFSKYKVGNVHERVKRAVQEVGND